MSQDAAVLQKVGFLKRVPLFAGIEDSLLGILAEIMSLESQPAGTYLCKQGGPGDACFIVGHGKVDVLIGEGEEEKKLATLSAGNVVGEVALIDGKKRSASVRAQTQVTVFTLSRDDFDRLMMAGNKASLQLLDNIAKDLVSRVRKVNDRFGELFSNPDDTIATLTTKLEALRAESESTMDIDEGTADEMENLMKLVGYQKTPSSR